MTERAGTAVLLTFARRGEEQVVAGAAAALRGRAARVVALGTAVSEPALRAAGIEEVILYRDGRGARAIMRELRALRPQVAGIVYWDGEFSGHLKLEAAALASGARRVLRFAPESEARPVGRAGLTWSVAAKTARAIGCAGAGAAMCGVALLALRAADVRAGGARASRP